MVKATVRCVVRFRPMSKKDTVCLEYMYQKSHYIMTCQISYQISYRIKIYLTIIIVYVDDDQERVKRW